MSFFGTDLFLETLADTHYPGRAARPVEAEVGAERFRVLKVGKRRIVVESPFLDFHTPVRSSGGGGAERVDWLPRADRGMISVGGWQKVRRTLSPAGDAAGGDRTGARAYRLLVGDRSPAWEAAPLVDWSVFGSGSDFQAHVKRSRSGLFRDTRRRVRRLEERLGPVTTVFDADPQVGLMDQCFAWKAEQYKESGLPNLFASARNVALFRELARRRAAGGDEGLVVSALFAGGTPVAIHLGVVWNRQFHYWVPAFDRRLGGFAPGRILLHAMLEESRARGHETFEFLIGDEAYKFHYATDVRLVGSVGRPPIAARAWQRVRPAMAAALKSVPPAHGAVQAVRFKMREI